MKNWINVEDYLPQLNQKVWYYFELLGKFLFPPLKNRLGY